MSGLTLVYMSFQYEMNLLILHLFLFYNSIEIFPMFPEPALVMQGIYEVSC